MLSASLSISPLIGLLLVPILRARGDNGSSTASLKRGRVAGTRPTYTLLLLQRCLFRQPFRNRLEKARSQRYNPKSAALNPISAGDHPPACRNSVTRRAGGATPWSGSRRESIEHTRGRQGHCGVQVLTAQHNFHVLKPRHGRYVAEP